MSLLQYSTCTYCMQELWLISFDSQLEFQNLMTTTGQQTDHTTLSVVNIVWLNTLYMYNVQCSKMIRNSVYDQICGSQKFLTSLHCTIVLPLVCVHCQIIVPGTICNIVLTNFTNC